jgi:hypothetical protein
MDSVLNSRIDALCEDGRRFWFEFDSSHRQEHWHPFVPSDYDQARSVLLSLRRPGLRFLEWGSATGVITIMADLMGFDACGIELDPDLASFARRLAERFGSDARYATGSFIPLGWTWKPPDGDGRLATIGDGPSGYLDLKCSLDDFDIVYGYPWSGEEALMHDLMRCHGHRDALLLLHTVEHGIRAYRRGVEVQVQASLD